MSYTSVTIYAGSTDAGSRKEIESRVCEPLFFLKKGEFISVPATLGRWRWLYIAKMVIMRWLGGGHMESSLDSVRNLVCLYKSARHACQFLLHGSANHISQIEWVEDA